jgi:hypothetical protein
MQQYVTRKQKRVSSSPNFRKKDFFWHVELFIRKPMMPYKASLDIKRHVIDKASCYLAI